jgi:hypothetical protein
MAITKLRTAEKREYDCAGCEAKIKIGDKYYDSNEKANPPKPFPTKKWCLTCGEAQQAK